MRTRPDRAAPAIPARPMRGDAGTARETAGRGGRDREGLSPRLGSARPRTRSLARRLSASPDRAACSRPRGNILVQPTINKTVAIYRATDGKKLWEMNVDQAAVAGPITYMIDGEQYIALNAGWGGSPVYNLNKNGPFRIAHRQAAGVQARRQGRDAAADAAADRSSPPAASLRAPEAQVTRGRELYAQTCVRCHGENAIGGVKDLRWMTRGNPRGCSTTSSSRASTARRAWRASPTCSARRMPRRSTNT